MSTSAIPDEQPKRRVARRVMTPKRRYFVPEHGVSVKAENVDKAVEAARKAVTKKEKVGDAE